MAAYNVDYEVLEASTPDLLGAAIVTYLETKDSTTNALVGSIGYFQVGSRFCALIVHAG